MLIKIQGDQMIGEAAPSFGQHVSPVSIRPASL
jgi:hypothetical protein